MSFPRKRESRAYEKRDCRVAPLLAMTEEPGSRIKSGMTERDDKEGLFNFFLGFFGECDIFEFESFG